MLMSKKHIAYMQKDKKLKLCYIPTYNMPPGLKCVFLNMSIFTQAYSKCESKF